MLLYAGSAVRLKCALGHRNALLILKENLCHGGKYLVYLRLGQESSRGGGAPLSRLPLVTGARQGNFSAKQSSKRLALHRSTERFACTSRQFFLLSPSMVQLKRESTNYCEWGIAMTSECATIGSVQERFQASHGTRNHLLSRYAGHGTQHADQAGFKEQPDSERELD